MGRYGKRAVALIPHPSRQYTSLGEYLSCAHLLGASPGAVSCVIMGAEGGFFLREKDGSYRVSHVQDVVRGEDVD